MTSKPFFILCSAWFILSLPFQGWSQASGSSDYTSFFTGSEQDATVQPLGGVCLMGGATEDDNAMRWFLQRANGGDVLVLRASGSDGYNNYLYSELGVNVNSVETIVFHTSNASNSTYVQNRIEQAEAIWLAGGNQWNYVNYWRNTPIAEKINQAVNSRNAVIGGTSAGMAVLGQYYFSAQNGSITSATALSTPFHPNVTPDATPFLSVPFMQHVITDTHYDNPDRRGRHMVFMARLLSQGFMEVKGIACEEYTAVCVDPGGNARVFGDFPAYQDYAYFIQVNCEVPNNTPEILNGTNPLTWNKNQSALKVCKIPGTTNGSNTFNLNDWKSTSGGTWLHWSAIAGDLTETSASAPYCEPTAIEHFQEENSIRLFPNPAQHNLFLTLTAGHYTIELIDISGKICLQQVRFHDGVLLSVDVSTLAPGLYLLCAQNTMGVRQAIRVVVQH